MRILLKKEFIFVFLIITAGFIIRWNNIEKIPYGIEGDEINWITNSLFYQYNILGAERGNWSQNDALAQIYPVSIKINQLSFILFEKDYYSPKKMLVFVSIFSLFFFYILSRKFLSVKASLITLLLFSFATYKLVTSRIAFPHVYSELFVYPAIILILNIAPRQLLKNSIYSFSAGLLLTLSLLTYNLAFLLPVTCFLILIVQIVKKHITWINALLILFMFLFALLLTSKLWLKSLHTEISMRGAMLDNSSFSIKSNNLSLGKLRENLHTVADQLFYSLKYNTADMLVSYPKPLINNLISGAFIIGFILAVFRIKNYFPLIIWLLSSGFIYQVILRFQLPRMWFLTIGVLYLLAGLFINLLLQIINKTHYKLSLNSDNTKKWRFFYLFIYATVTVLIVIPVIFIITSDIKLFYTQAINNPSYKISYRESIDVVKKYKNNLRKNVIFVSDTEVEAARINPIISFYYLVEHPDQAEILKNLSRQEIGSLTEEEFKKKYSLYLNRLNIIITKEISFNTVKSLVQQKGQCQYYTNRHKYYSELTPFDCR